MSTNPATGTAASVVAAETATDDRDDERRTPALLWIAVAAVAIVVAAAAAILAVTSGDDDTTIAGSEPGAAVSAVPSGAASGSAQPGAGASTPPSAGGAGAGDPTLVASAAVLTGDLVQMTEDVTWPAGGPADVVLALPALDEVGGLPDWFDPQVQSLQVTIDGTAVEATAGAQPDTWVLSAPAGTAPHVMSVSYQLAGAVARSTPSQAGRALALVAVLSSDAVNGVPVEIKLAGAGVLTVVCPGAPGTSPALCGRHTGDTWTAEVPPGSPAVALVQVDLAPPV